MLSPLEKAVLDMLLDTPGESFQVMREQLSHALISRRRFEKNGFLVLFEIPPDAPVRRDLANTTLSNVSAQIEGLQKGAGFVLLVRDGVITKLEGFAYQEEWPENIGKFSLTRWS